MGSKKITGSSLAIDWRSIVQASCGFETLTTRRPAVWAKYASGDSEWCSAAPMPPPTGMRIVSGSATMPRVRACILANCDTIWSNAGYTKPSNWISHTGR